MRESIQKHSLFRGFKTEGKPIFLELVQILELFVVL